MIQTCLRILRKLENLYGIFKIARYAIREITRKDLIKSQFKISLWYGFIYYKLYYEAA